ncbi:cyclin-dependent protein kinase inhibitor SMR6-like [Zingiber officinale]|uniref:Uncharacterized protein n=1 Tax=Zingiber officinale TaxID=94328 RepID=A0A8J5KSX2_ZINOF|nr:cyclin-dependent protein kinase inhibitor SMR6-like [Zingiber officinale]KAG6490712.1 hypothetical protein ZIOFF_052022 [Zingiber officinale]
MASEVVAVGELPLLLPIKTALGGGEKIAAAVGEGGGEEEGGCVTPKSEQHVLKPPTVCPPAPKKPNPAKRSASAAPNCKEFFVVPRDLTSIFIPIPPKKRIRLI